MAQEQHLRAREEEERAAAEAIARLRLKQGGSHDGKRRIKAGDREFIIPDPDPRNV